MFFFSLSAGAAFSALLPDGRAQGVPGVCEYLGEHAHYTDQLVYPANGVAGIPQKVKKDNRNSKH
jgi:hypothetical protein